MGDTEQYDVAGDDRQLPAWADEQAASDYTAWDSHPDLYAAAVREAGDPEMFFGYEAPSWQSTKEPGPGVPENVPRSVPATSLLDQVDPEVSVDPTRPVYDSANGYEMVELGEVNNQPHPLSDVRPDARDEVSSSSEYYTSPNFDNGDWENEDDWENYHDDLREELGDEGMRHHPPVHAPLFAFEPGQRDIDVMWRWLRGMQPNKITERAEGWGRIASVLAGAEGTLRSRGQALRDAWHSAVDDQSAANNFLRQVGGTMWSMSWWWHLAHQMKTDLTTIANAIEEAREQLGPVYAHYQVALSLWNNWDELSQLPDGTELYLTGTHVDGYELPPPGVMSVDTHHQRAGDAPGGLDRRMRINHPGNPDWHPMLPVLYDQSTGESTDKDIMGPEDILEAYHQRAAETMQPLANLYNDAHAWMPTQEGFRGPNPLELALPLDPSDLDPSALIEQFGGPGAVNVSSMPSPPSMPAISPPPMPVTPGAIPVAMSAGVPGPAPAGVPTTLLGGELAGGPAMLGFSTSPVTVPPGAASAGVLPLAPVIPPIAVPGVVPSTGGGVPGGSSIPAPGGNPGTQLPGVTAPRTPPGVALPAATGPGSFPVSVPATLPGVAPGVPGTALGTASGAVPGVMAPGAAMEGVVPGALAPGSSAPGAGSTGLSVPVQGGAALPGVTANVADGQAGTMMPPPPPPMMPPMAPRQGQNGASVAGGSPRGGIPGQLPPPPPPMFVPPGRVAQQGRTPTAPQRIAPTLSGTARPARPAGLTGVRSAPGHPASPRPEPATQHGDARTPESVPVPGEQDRELWTVKKPKRLIQSSTPHRPVQHGKPIGSPG